MCNTNRCLRTSKLPRLLLPCLLQLTVLATMGSSAALAAPWLLAVLCGVLLLPWVAGGTSLTDRAALTCFFTELKGERWYGGWSNKRGWGTDATVGNWHGVVVDASNRVVQLRLAENSLKGATFVAVVELVTWVLLLLLLLTLTMLLKVNDRNTRSAD